MTRNDWFRASSMRTAPDTGTAVEIDESPDGSKGDSPDPDNA